MKLSICIPTYNRAQHLANCLASINIAAKNAPQGVEVCVSDNNSTDFTQDVVSQSNMVIPIKYHRNKQNIGISRNFLNVIDMATGEFSWLLGDDDLLLPDSLNRLLLLLQQYKSVDFFYVNAFHLTVEYVKKFPQPFDTVFLPKNMERFSTCSKSREMPFLGLINPNISFDFLGGMFLAVFRRQYWQNHRHKLNQDALLDTRTFSHFDNTFPHVKIFSEAFPKSKAYFNANPLVVSLSGAREWTLMNPFVCSVRLVEALKLYREVGLSWTQYVRCRNFALSNFLPDLARMLFNTRKSGWCFVSIRKHILSNCLYPNVYLSPFVYLMRKVQIFYKSTKIIPQQ